MKSRTMNERSPRFWLAVAAALAAAALLTAPQTSRADDDEVLEVEGRVSLTTDADGFPDPNGKRRDFSVDVSALADGTAVGRARVKNRAGDRKFEIKVDCLLVLENSIVMSGYVTKSSGPDDGLFPVGTAVVFAIRDNGDDDDDPADQISPVFAIADEPIPNLCFLFVEEFGPPPEEFLFPVERGDIDVELDD